MVRSQPPRQFAQDPVIGLRLGQRLDHRPRDVEEAGAAGLVEIVVLEEGRRRQDDVGHRRRLGQELLVDAGEEILAQEAGTDLRRIRRDHHRVGVLDEERRHRRPVAERIPVAGQDRADARLVEDADPGSSRSRPSINVLSMP